MTETDAVEFSRCHLAPTASSLAAALGYFDEEFSALPDGIRINAKLGDHSHEGDRYWMRHAANAKAMWARSHGADTRALAFSWYESAMPLYARCSSGVSTPVDLKGSRIASIHVAGQKFDYDRTVYLRPFVTSLSSAGLSLSDVEEVAFSVEREQVRDGSPRQSSFPLQMARKQIEWLLSGKVDAIASILPPQVVSFLDLRCIYDPAKDPDPLARVDLRALVVSGDALRERRDAVVAAVMAILRAGEWAAQHGQEAISLMAADAHIPEEILKARKLDAVRAAQIDTSAESISLMEGRKDFLLDAGVLEQDFDLAEWTDPSVLEEAIVKLQSRRGTSTVVQRGAAAR